MSPYEYISSLAVSFPVNHVFLAFQLLPPFNSSLVNSSLVNLFPLLSSLVTSYFLFSFFTSHTFRTYHFILSLIVIIPFFHPLALFTFILYLLIVFPSSSSYIVTLIFFMSSPVTPIKILYTVHSQVPWFFFSSTCHLFSCNLPPPPVPLERGTNPRSHFGVSCPNFTALNWKACLLNYTPHCREG